MVAESHYNVSDAIQMSRHNCILLTPFSILICSD